MGITRRDFLMRVGQAGGYSAAFTTMQSLGLMPMKAETASAIAAAPGSGKGVKIVVLGGGVSGLVTAYEAKKLGYDVTLLEARHRPGGRAWSARNGDVVEFVDGTKQPITWSEGLYQNMGPARLPSVHGTMLGYCRELKVPLEVEVNTSRSTLLQNDKVNGGKPVLQRKAINDTRGHVSELLSKAVAGGALDQELSTEDRQRIIDVLKIYGPLDKSGKYVGSDRADIKRYPGAGPQTMQVDDHPLSMHDLLDANFWGAELYEEAWDWQATMFQPVNGMQQISIAFARALGSTVVYDAPVTEIAKTSKGVRVGYSKGGTTKYIEADYAVCAMPLSILTKIKADLDPAHKGAVDRGGASYRGSCKVPWESRRFWETDYNIYGGLSFLSQGPSPIWYPSANLFSERGIVVAGYMDETNEGFDKLSLQQKFEASRASIEKLHPGHGKELEKPIYCGWKHIKWNEGSWIGMLSQADYDVITEPDGPIYFAGDHTSHVVGWQEGAALSGRRAVQMISDKVKAARLGGNHRNAVTA
ncbi:flavin monoamine oxidase family protein [Edaphobacter flagellatus]|uniref:flavin monoamine oxidase family protein n=1 Tax=Edaphobacter flagellatus TaxID=1933044 RepID=UPI0021B2144F|nr:FAD-dependent oxidoreductase [Edaphobacter flagellatus]